MPAPVLVLAAAHYLSEFSRHGGFTAYEGVDIDRVTSQDDETYQTFVTETARRLQDGELAGVVGLTDAGALAATHLEEVTGRSTGRVQRMAEVMHKRRFREELNASGVTRVHTWAPGEAPVPAFMKPIHASLSYGASAVESRTQLGEHLVAHQPGLQRSNQRYTRILHAAGLDGELVDDYLGFYTEEQVPAGLQVTVDLYVTGGDVQVVAVTTSRFDHTGLSFHSFDAPADLEPGQRAGVEELARQVMGVAGLDQLVCNMELVWSGGQWWFIELNVRPSTQFSYALHLVTGIDTLAVAEALARQETPPAPDQPVAEAVSIQIRRRPEDGRVTRVPSDDEIRAALGGRPGARYNHLAQEGERLGELSQDLYSYRYGELVLPHTLDEDPDRVAGQIFEQLPVTFADVSDEPAAISGSD